MAQTIDGTKGIAQFKTILDFYKAYIYNDSGDNMDEFMNYNFNISKITLAVLVPAGSGEQVHRDRPSHGIVYNLNGGKLYRFSDGLTLKPQNGDILYLPKYSDYVVDTRTEEPCIAINFDLFERERTFEPFLFTAKNFQMFQNAFRDAALAWETRQCGYEMKCKSILYGILYDMQKAYHAGYVPSSKYLKIKKAVSYIQENCFTEDMKITRLSEMCGMTPEYFRRLFGECLMISPAKYITDLRITRAKELLSSGMFTVAQAASMSGFGDTGYFCRMFKKVTSCSPGAYKKR